ncbi:transposase [Streptomyces sp. SD31]|uniref:transposase n=1 Tax=Streptomyces sp. SD31 TaxID=3452208 RepID=UPI003F8C926D
MQLGARTLAEIGDDRGRFAAARRRKAYAGSPPVTSASGNGETSITHQRVKNDRLNHAGYLRALSTRRACVAANAFASTSCSTRTWMAR